MEHRDNFGTEDGRILGLGGRCEAIWCPDKWSLAGSGNVSEVEQYDWKIERAYPQQTF